MDKQALGKTGESLACGYVETEGMRVLARNYHCREGEIDIVAHEDETIVFIEVKTRSGTRYGRAAEAVTKRKMEKIITAAMTYMAENELFGANMRFDVAEVYATGGKYEINYIRSAFEG